jgi:long-chain fatty acid transport protein
MMQAKVKEPAPWRGVGRKRRRGVGAKTGVQALTLIRNLGNWRTGFKFRVIFNYLNSLIFLSAVLLLGAASAEGAGFALLQQGTAAMAQGNAFVADASDASAIFYNPAGLNQLTRPVIYTGGFLNYPSRDFQGEGVSSETNHRAYTTLSAYLAVPVNSRVALGIGYFSPFGMGTAWPPTWEGRYVTTFSSLKTYNLHPVASVKILDNLSFAAGFDVMWSGVELKKKNQVIFNPFPGVNIQLPDAESRFNADGVGYGYNLGALYEPMTGVKLGVSYRSNISVKYRGDLSLEFRPSPIAGQQSNGSATLNFPPSVTMGINYSRLKPFAFEFDTTWTGWSSYKALDAALDTPVGGSRRVFVPKDWHDAWAFRFGANYEIKEGLKVRAGYIYDLTPVPDGTFDAQLPDANRHIFTVGGDYKIGRFTLGVAYNYILAEGRSKNNVLTEVPSIPATPQANGHYNSDTHTLAASCQFQF